MASFLPTFRTALQTFTSSSSTLQILRTFPISPPPPPPKILYILDSSFNPPTLAHLRIAAAALDSCDSSASSKRLLLLLAIKNADKAAQPAAFEHRLAMMAIMAEEMLRGISAESKQEPSIAVDIGVTKLPYFVDKCAAIASSENYKPDPSRSGEPPIEQVHLIGFDTLIRLLNTKYYPPEHTLAPLEELFKHHQLRVSYRADDDWGSRQEQDAYLQDLRDGKWENEGGRREWAEKIQVVTGRLPADQMISSTRVRKAATERDENLTKELCTGGVVKYIWQEGLYPKQERS